MGCGVSEVYSIILYRALKWSAKDQKVYKWSSFKYKKKNTLFILIPIIKNFSQTMTAPFDVLKESSSSVNVFGIKYVHAATYFTFYF